MKKTIFALALVMALTLPQMLQAQADGPGTGTRWAYPSPTGVSALELRGIAFGNGKYVIVGGPNQGASAGSILYSTDGLKWTLVAKPPVCKHFYGVAFGGGVFVAVGREGKIAQSTDGITWKDISGPFGTNTIYDIAFGNNMFVAVGQNGKIAYAAANSPTKWTAVADTTFGASTIYTVVNHGATFYAGGANGNLAYSANDIKKWTAVANPFQGKYSYAIRGIKAGPQGSGLWVAVGDNGIMAATAGTNWKLIADMDAFDNCFNAITYANDRFVAVGQAPGVNVYSTDGLKWTATQDIDKRMSITDGTLTSGGGFRGGETRYNRIIWANGRFTAIGHPAIISHSY